MVFPSRVLIIEDNEDNLTLMRLLLERANYEVLATNDGRQGLEIARTEHPDIILLDLAMPDMDGWAVATRLKADILTKDIPVVAVTAHALPKDRERALASGCDSFIVKPFSIVKLINEIERLVDVL